MAFLGPGGRERGGGDCGGDRGGVGVVFDVVVGAVLDVAGVGDIVIDRDVAVNAVGVGGVVALITIHKVWVCAFLCDVSQRRCICRPLPVSRLTLPHPVPFFRADSQPKQPEGLGTPNMETLMAKVEEPTALVNPPEAVMDRIHFVINNVTASNLSSKVEATRAFCWVFFCVWSRSLFFLCSTNVLGMFFVGGGRLLIFFKAMVMSLSCSDDLSSADFRRFFEGLYLNIFL